jgi:HEAT repeat protein
VTDPGGRNVAQPGDPGAPPVRARRRQVALAGHTGDAATARAGLHDPAPRVRATALGALARLGLLGRVEVAAGLADAHPEVRRRAAELAAAVEGVSLLEVLADDDTGVAEMAAWACGEREDADPAVVRALSSMATTHDDSLCREAAVAALGAIGHPDGLPAILAATRDRATVRRRAVIALAPFDGAGVDEALERAAGDRDWQVRQAAEDLRREG